MANVKKIICDHSATAVTVYSIIRREADSYLLNDADGAFAAAPADPYVTLTENSTIKGRYEKSESRAVWDDGLYTVAVYKQAGGSPSPVADEIIGSGELYISSDLEIGKYTDAENAAAVRTELTTELGRIDAAITTRLASASYTTNVNVASINGTTIVGDGSTTPFNV